VEAGRPSAAREFGSERGVSRCCVEVLAREEKCRGQPLRCVRTHTLARMRFRERLAQDRRCFRFVTAVAVKPAEEDERFGTEVARACGSQHLVEQRARPRRVAGDEPVSGRRDGAVLRVVGESRRRQPERLLAEIRRSRGRAACVCVLGSAFQSRSDLRVRAFHGEREMACRLFHLVDDRCESSVSVAAFRVFVHSIGSGGKEWVDETNPVVLDGDQLGGDRGM